eukprot:m.309 g.309  ORF g.309 m.309 type:complete len:385 (-) comp391_c0_seq1:7-1161(-)
MSQLVHTGIFVLTLCLSVSALCNSSVQCSLNGDCSANSLCQCDDGWTGDSCDILNLAVGNSSYGYHNTTHGNGASWGGRAIFDNSTQLWHLFAAEMALGCDLNHYGSNSQIIRAVSRDPWGPFTKVEVVIHAFAHNPTVQRLRDGRYLLAYIGSPAQPVNCSNTSTSATSATSDTARAKGSAQRGVLTSNTMFALASRIEGPWRQFPINFTNVSGSTVLDCSQTNPSPVILDNGTVVLAITAGFCHNHIEQVAIAVAPSLAGPFRLLQLQPILKHPSLCLSNQQFEDPFLYRTRRGWHLLLHGMCPTGVLNAKYAYSEDLVSWHLADNPPYSYEVAFTDRSPIVYARMERPQLSLSEDGTPLVLFNGVKGFEHSYTLARQVIGT